MARFDAFISYSRTNEPAAERLEQFLERWRIPRKFRRGRKRLEVFRDREDAGLGELSGVIEKALDDSESLIVLCSPASRASLYVDPEIEYFAKRHGPERIIPVLVAGRPNSEVTKDDQIQDKAFSVALRRYFAEPLAADLRSRQGERRWQRAERFREARFQILAKLLHTDKSQELVDRDRWRRRLRLGAAVLLPAAMLLYLTWSYFDAYVALKNPRHLATQRQEIVIERGRLFTSQVFPDIATTGLFVEDLRDPAAMTKLADRLRLGLFSRHKWDVLGEQLTPLAGGRFLVRSGFERLGIEKLSEAIKEDHGSGAEAALHALGEAGTTNGQAVAALREVLANDDDPQLWAAAATALGVAGADDDKTVDSLRRVLANGNWLAVMGRSDTVVAAVRTLGKMGGNERAVATLRQALATDDYFPARRAAAEVLAELGADDTTVAALRQALSTEGLRTEAAAALTKLGVNDNAMVTALRGMLETHDAMDAVSALRHAASTNENAIAALREAFDNPGPDVQLAAASALIEVGAAGEATVAVLEKIVWASNGMYIYLDTRLEAVKALLQMGRTEQAAIAALRKALGHDERRVRSDSARALITLGAADEDFIAAYREELDHSDSDRRRNAAIVLGNLGVFDAAILAVLRGGFGYDDDAKSTLLELARTRVADDTILVTLRELLRSGDSWDRITAADALAELNAADRATLVALREALQDSDVGVEVRIAAGRVLGELGAADPATLVALREALQDSDVHLRIAAGRVLGELGAADETTAAVLVGAFGDDDPPFLKEAAVEALGKLGAVAGPVEIAAIRRTLKADTTFDEKVAAGALGELGKTNDPAIDALREALGEGDAAVRTAAVNALGELGRTTDGAFAPLQEALADADPDVRQNAGKALSKLLSGSSPTQLLEFITHKDSSWRTAGARALQCQENLSKETLKQLDEIRLSDPRPWARLGAWEASALRQEWPDYCADD